MNEDKVARVFLGEEATKQITVSISGKHYDYPVYKITFLAERPDGGAFVNVNDRDINLLGEITAEEDLKLQEYRPRYFGPRENYWHRFRRAIELGKQNISDNNFYCFYDNEAQELLKPFLNF